MHQRRVLQGAGGQARYLSAGDVDPVGSGEAGWKPQRFERLDDEIGAPVKEPRIAHIAFGPTQVKAPVEIAPVVVDAATARRACVDADPELAGQPLPVRARGGAAMQAAHQALVVDPQAHGRRAKASIDVAQQLSIEPQIRARIRALSDEQLEGAVPAVSHGEREPSLSRRPTRR